MSKDVVAEFIVKQVVAPLAPDGTGADLLDVRDGVAYVQYRKGHNEDCVECVLSPEDFRLFLLEAFSKRAPHITDVKLDSIEAVPNVSN